MCAPIKLAWRAPSSRAGRTPSVCVGLRLCVCALQVFRRTPQSRHLQFCQLKSRYLFLLYHSLLLFPLEIEIRASKAFVLHLLVFVNVDGAASILNPPCVPCFYLCAFFFPSHSRNFLRFATRLSFQSSRTSVARR